MSIKNFYPTLVVFVFLSLLSPVFSQKAYACSCMTPGTPQEELKDVDVVFMGKVTQVEDTQQFEPQKSVSFIVEKAWKGLSKEDFNSPLQIVTPGNSAMCGIDFTEGETYVVYAGTNSENGNLQAGLCSRTALASQATDDLAQLGDGISSDTESIPNQNKPKINTITLLIVGTAGLILGSIFAKKR